MVPLDGGRGGIRESLLVRNVVRELAVCCQSRIEHNSYFYRFQRNGFPQKWFSAKRLFNKILSTKYFLQNEGKARGGGKQGILDIHVSGSKCSYSLYRSWNNAVPIPIASCACPNEIRRSLLVASSRSKWSSIIMYLPSFFFKPQKMALSALVGDLVLLN